MTSMHDLYMHAAALETQTRLADMRARLTAMTTERTLAHGLTDDEAAHASGAVMSPYAFWHFTCAHGRTAIGQTGIVLPQPGLAPMKLAWFTDMPHPLREQVGLTSYLLSCDRMGYRYRVTSARDIKAWADADVPDDLRAMLDAAPGARPEHWFVAEKAVPVRLDAGWRYSKLTTDIRGGL